jgi:hypothetical protein
MLMTDEQRRWWFANHPEYSWSRTRARLLGRRPRRADFSENSNTALANERLRKENFIQKMMDAGWKRPEAEKKWQLAESVAGPGRGLAWAIESFSPFGRAGKVLSKAGLALAARRGSGARPPRLPPKGTPERAKIEADRKRGSRQKKANELAEIDAGGKGSGAWTKKELEEIKKTREFPPDTIWHHEPTVANRPELADNPLAVRPIRGGRKGHLQDGHGGNYQNPYDPGGKAPWE